VLQNQPKSQPLKLLIPPLPLRFPLPLLRFQPLL
jgi:hypothetical protein